MTLINFPPDNLLDLPPWVGQRQATFSFTLIDGITGQKLRELTPIRDTPATLVHDTTRTIPRTLSCVLGVDDAAVIDPINNRVLLHMLIGGRRYPLGRYMFVDDARNRFSSGSIAPVSLTDEMFIIDQASETGFSTLVSTSLAVSGFGSSIAPLETVDQSITRLLAPFDILLSIESTPFSSIGMWTVGTSKAQMLLNLSRDGDYFSPWFNHNGTLKIIRTFDPGRAIPDFNYDVNKVVYADTIVETSNLIDAANRIVVVSNGVVSADTAQAPVIGTFDIPPSAPHSIFNRGFVIPDVRQIQVESSLQAEVIARNIGIHSTAFEFVEMSTAPDPRHDGYNTIVWDNRLWLETAWTMELSEGGVMRHKLQRVYA